MYLTIITTVLVLTQVIRLIQNAIQLRRQGAINKHNDRIMEIWEHMDQWIAAHSDKPWVIGVDWGKEE